MKTSKNVLLVIALSLHLMAFTHRCHAAPGDLDLSFVPGSAVMGYVRAIVVQPNGKVLISSDFGGIARLNADGSVDTGFLRGTAGIYPDHVDALAVQPDGKVLIGGYFSFNGGPLATLARLNMNGTRDSTFNLGTGADNTVFCLALQTDGKVLIGGDFTSVNGTERKGIARLHVDGSLDTAFQSAMDGSVNALALQPDSKVLSISHARIARLNADGSVDASFNPGTGANGRIRSVALQPDGKVLIGGSFTTVDGIARNRIARLNSDGSLDTGFNPGTGANNAVLAVTIQADGKAIVAGFFTSLNGASRNYIARLNPDGSLDASFNPGTGASSVVRSVVVQADGKALIGGDFTSVNGIEQNQMARLYTDSLPSRLGIIFAGNHPELQLTGEVGRQYILEYVSALPAANNVWTALPAFALTNSPQAIQDATVANAPQRFYRARQVTP